MPCITESLFCLPQGVHKCTVMLTWGMPVEMRTELNRGLKEKSIQIVDGGNPVKHVLFCNCEAIRCRIFYGEAGVIKWFHLL